LEECIEALGMKAFERPLQLRDRFHLVVELPIETEEGLGVVWDRRPSSKKFAAGASVFCGAYSDDALLLPWLAVAKYGASDLEWQGSEGWRVLGGGAAEASVKRA
jgi:hypothetical protein